MARTSSGNIPHPKLLGSLLCKVGHSLTLSIVYSSLTETVFFMLFGGPFVGKIFDDYGPRYLLAGGAFLHVFGLMMASISKKYYQFLLSQAVCSAIGASMVFYPAFTCVSCSDLWATRHLLTLFFSQGIDMVLRQAGRCPRPGRSWLIVRRRHSSHYGHQTDSGGRFWLGDADLCLPDFGTPHFRKPNGALSYCTDEAPI